MSLVDWHSLGEVLYRKWQVYDMAWGEDFNIDDYIICGAPFGGPLAMIKADDNRNKQIVVTNATKEANKAAESADSNEYKHFKDLWLFSSAGKLLAEVEFGVSNKQNTVVTMHWTDEEQLIVVLIDGNCIMFNIQGKMLKQFLLWDSSASVHVLECKCWGDGVAVVASDLNIFTAEDICSLDNIRKNRYATGLRQDRPYTSMAIIPPSLSRQGFLEVLLATEDNSIIVVDENEVEDQLLQDRIFAPVTMMVVAPNGRFIACYRRDGVLTVMSTTFTSKILEFDTKSMTRPMNIEWCGEDSVVLLWRNTGLVMVGPYGDWLNFPYDGSVQLIAEHDCCRILTSNSCEVLQRVPPSTEAIRKIGSTDPAALLYDAMEAFEAGDPKSDENLRDIAGSNQLVEAVQSCLTAAVGEFELDKQQSLMKAASYGKAFCQMVDPDAFVSTANKLRVLNAVRSPDVGIPLTVQQYNRLTPETLVGRLTMRNHHHLVMKICELLRLPIDTVLIHWGSEKVKAMSQAGCSDEEICSTVRAKIELYSNPETNPTRSLNRFGLNGSAPVQLPRISYLEIAKAAFHMNRKRLAIMFLDGEESSSGSGRGKATSTGLGLGSISEQVPLLLSMQEDALALHKAVLSEDTDLIYLVVIHLEKIVTSNAHNNNSNSGGGSGGSLENFFRLVFTYPEALNLLKVYYKSKSTSAERASTLNALYYYSRNYLEAGLDTVMQSQSHASSRIQLLREAVVLFGNSFPPSYVGGLPTAITNSASTTGGGAYEHLSSLYPGVGGGGGKDQFIATSGYTNNATAADMAFYKSVTEDQIDLLDIQKTLVLRSGREFVDLTLIQTVSKIIEMCLEFPLDTQRWEVEIGKIVKRFKIQDKVMYQVRIQVYARHQR